MGTTLRPFARRRAKRLGGTLSEAREAAQRSRLAEVALRPEPRPKARRGADALRRARRMSLGEQSSTCRASTF
jgi:hypothetical protein